VSIEESIVDSSSAISSSSAATTKKEKNGQGNNKKCETIVATWLVQEVWQNGDLKFKPPLVLPISNVAPNVPPKFEPGDAVLVYAKLCNDDCSDPIELVGDLWLKEFLVGGGRVPDGGYSFADGSILFQGAVSEEVHEGPGGFELGITGGTGKYRGATGYIIVDKAKVVAVPPGDEFEGLTPARTTHLYICGI
jgi:hypothetical protein